jgi:hypothetical protein
MSNKSPKGHGKNVTVRMSYRSSASGQFTTVGTSGVITRKSGSGKAIYASKAASVLSGQSVKGVMASRPVNVIKPGTVVMLPFKINRARKTHTAADEQFVVRIAKAAEQTRADPGEDITGVSDEEFLAKLFG